VVPRSVCALLGAGKPSAVGVSETGRIPRVCMTTFGPGLEVVGRGRSSGDLSVYVDLTSRGYSGVWGCAGGFA